MARKKGISKDDFCVRVGHHKKNLEDTREFLIDLEVEPGTRDFKTATVAHGDIGSGLRKIEDLEYRFDCKHRLRT